MAKKQKTEQQVRRLSAEMLFKNRNHLVRTNHPSSHPSIYPSIDAPADTLSAFQVNNLTGQKEPSRHSKNFSFPNLLGSLFLAFFGSVWSDIVGLQNTFWMMLVYPEGPRAGWHCGCCCRRWTVEPLNPCASWFFAPPGALSKWPNGLTGPNRSTQHNYVPPEKFTYLGVRTAAVDAYFIHGCSSITRMYLYLMNLSQ